MRHRNNIFEQETYRGTGIKAMSAVQLTVIILSAISVIAAVYIVANFNEITARMANICRKYFNIRNATYCGSYRRYLSCYKNKVEMAYKILEVMRYYE